MAIDSTPMMTVQAAAAYLGISAKLVYKACASQGLQHCRFMGGKRIRPTIRTTMAWVNDWAAKRATMNAF